MELLEVEKTIESLKSEVQFLKNRISMISKESEEKILSTVQASKYMQVNRKRIELWRNTGLIHGIQVGNNGRWLYKQSELDNLQTEWSGYDLTTSESIAIAKAMKKRDASSSKNKHLSTENWLT